MKIELTEGFLGEAEMLKIGLEAYIRKLNASIKEAKKLGLHTSFNKDLRDSLKKTLKKL